MSRAILVPVLVDIIRAHEMPAGWRLAEDEAVRSIAEFCASLRQQNLRITWYHDALGETAAVTVRFHRELPVGIEVSRAMVVGAADWAREQRWTALHVERARVVARALTSVGQLLERLVEALVAAQAVTPLPLEQQVVPTTVWDRLNSEVAP
jgi:hypothetical protein